MINREATWVADKGGGRLFLSGGGFLSLPPWKRRRLRHSNYKGDCHIILLRVLLPVWIKCLGIVCSLSRNV